MSRQLLLVTLGPVQEFIAQARRTRDLWFGSHLLSEVSRAAASSLAKQGAHLIFPALESGHPELGLCLGPLRRSQDPSKEPDAPPMAIPNKLLAEVPDSVDPEALAKAARSAAENCWQGFAEAVRSRCVGLIAPEAGLAWGEQLRTFLEFSAAWTPIAEDKDGYSRARNDLERELASRKLLRDFPAWEQQRGSVPKSSLDGARETVLVDGDKRPPGLVKRYRISSGEQLDAVGLVKRAGGEPDQFIPIANIALAAWIDAAKTNFPEELKSVAAECKTRGFGGVERRDLACGRVFAFDAEVFLQDRWAPLCLETLDPETQKKTKRRGPEQEALRGQVEHLRAVLSPLFVDHEKKKKRMGAPNPYVACLVADGDHMGRALDNVHDVDAHRTFSERLSHFATIARRIIEQEHRGVLVYAGGDDVLAFVNLVDALPCAEALRLAFAEVVRQTALKVDLKGTAPTLSVGIGIGHLLENLGHLRQLGSEAEKLAKTTRDALAVVLEKRAGSRTELLARWQDEPVARLGSAAALLQTDLSLKKVFEIQHSLRRLPPPGSLLAGEQPGWVELLRHEVGRVLSRTDDGKGVTAAEVGLSWDSGNDYDRQHAILERWLASMLIAHAVHDATLAATPGPAGRGDREDG